MPAIIHDTVLYKPAPSALTKTASDPRTIRFIASHERVDADGQVVLVDGIDEQTRFLRNPVLLQSHDHRAPAVARVVHLWRAVLDGAKALVGEAHFPAGDADAERALQKVRAGLLNAVSIGFKSLVQGPPQLPDQRGVTHVKSLLYEISLVALPACPTCLVTSKCACRSAEKEHPMNRWGDHEIVLDVIDDDDLIAFPPATIHRLIREAAASAFADLVTQTLQDCLDRKRGRIVESDLIDVRW